MGNSFSSIWLENMRLGSSSFLFSLYASTGNLFLSLACRWASSSLSFGTYISRIDTIQQILRSRLTKSGREMNLDFSSSSYISRQEAGEQYTSKFVPSWFSCQTYLRFIVLMPFFLIIIRRELFVPQS